MSWLVHTLALWFAKQDFQKKMTHGPEGVSKSAKTRQKGLQNIQRPKVIKARGGTMLPGLSRAKWSPEAGEGATVVSC